MTGTRVFNGGTNNATSGPMNYADVAKRELSRGLNLQDRIGMRRMAGQAQPRQMPMQNMIYWLNNRFAGQQAQQPQAGIGSITPEMIARYQALSSQTPQQTPTASAPVDSNAPVNTSTTPTPSPNGLPSQQTGQFMMPLFTNRTPTDSLIPPNMAAAYPGLPLDLSYANDLAKAYGSYQTDAQTILNAMNQAGQQYNTNARGLEEQINQIDPQTRAEMANRGMGWSGVYPTTLGNRYRQGQTAVNQLIQDYANSQQQYNMGMNAAGNTYSQATMAALADLTQRLAPQAGTGLGITPDVTSVKDPGSSMNTYMQNQIKQITAKPPAPPPVTTKPPAPAAKAPVGSVPAKPSGLFRRGSSGSGVRALQTMLNKAGAKLKVDGIFGPLTDAALRNYQSKNGLVVDGIAGPKTMAKLWS